MKIPALILCAITAFSVGVQAQSQRAVLSAPEWRKDDEAEVIQQFTNLLSIPNVHSDHDNIQLVSMLQKRGAVWRAPEAKL